MTEKCWENIAKNAAFEGGRGGALKCHGWKLKYADVAGFGFRV